LPQTDVEIVVVNKEHLTSGGPGQICRVGPAEETRSDPI